MRGYLCPQPTYTNVNKICRLYRFTLTVGIEELFRKSSEMIPISLLPSPPSYPKKVFLYFYHTQFCIAFTSIEGVWRNYNYTRIFIVIAQSCRSGRSQHLEPGGVAAGRLHSGVVNLSLFINSTSSTHIQCFALPPDSTLHWYVV